MRLGGVLKPQRANEQSGAVTWGNAAAGGVFRLPADCWTSENLDGDESLWVVLMQPLHNKEKLIYS